MKKLAVSKKQLDEYEAVFFALSHVSRRHILMCLSQKSGPMLGGEIADQLSCSWPTTTSHLQNLEKAGLVTVQKQGREQLYEISAKRLDVILKWIDEVRG